MTISEFEEKRCEKELEKFLTVRRPPPYIRDQVDMDYRIENQSVVLFELRPDLRNPENKIEIPFAKATYVKTEDHWKVYWQKSDLKWHLYSPEPTVQYIEEFLAVVDEDANACFFG